MNLFGLSRSFKCQVKLKFLNRSEALKQFQVFHIQDKNYYFIYKLFNLRHSVTSIVINFGETTPFASLLGRSWELRATIGNYFAIETGFLNHTHKRAHTYTNRHKHPHNTLLSLSHTHRHTHTHTQKHQHLL
jgi:hypothetical protein